ncbi:MAG: preprotein translocase subunit SecE [Clostridia bacterium]|nr:preprotein translocase subunit SecE [Clostridia bacterium]
MANKQQTQQTSEEKVEAGETVVEEQVVEEVKAETKTEEVKPVTPAKKENKKDNNKKQKKEKKQSKLGKKFKETTSELKKVSWPTFAQVCKKTGVVLAVVIIFAVVLFGIDRLLSWLFGLLTGI